MIEASSGAEKHWSPENNHINRYGEEFAQRFAVTDGLRRSLMHAFDLLAKDAEDVHDAQDAAHAFETLWNMVNKEHDQILVDHDRNKNQVAAG